MITAYLSFPYTADPQKFTEEVRKLATKLQDKYPDIVLLIPHYCSNWMKQGQTTEEHTLAIWYDIALVQKADIFIIGCELDYSKSQGMVWEYNIARMLGKKIYSASELLRKNVKFD